MVFQAKTGFYILSLDAGLIHEGYHSDAARTHAVGNISEEAKRLIEVTKQSFFEGIKLAVPGNHLFDISEAIQKYVESNGYSVVRDLVGHGIGTHLHEDPQIPNFKQRRKGMKLRPGMTLAIEPMKVVMMLSGWTMTGQLLLKTEVWLHIMKTRSSSQKMVVKY